MNRAIRIFTAGMVATLVISFSGTTAADGEEAKIPSTGTPFGLFDVKKIPFSYCGSWMSFSIPRKETELWFRSHHNGENNLCPLQVIADGEIVKPEITASPSLLVLTHGQGRIEICFERPGTVRMRGQVLGLQFGGKNLAYSEGPNLATLNVPHNRRYQMEMLHGSIALRQVVPTQSVYPSVVVISPAADGRWEFAMDEFWSTWQRPARKGFDDCVVSARTAFSTFLETMPAVRPQDRATRESAAYVDWSCTMSPCGCDPAYTWTSSVFLLMAERMNR